MDTALSDVEILLQHDAFVRAVARSLLDDEHRVEDVVQQTWMIALERSPQRHTSLRPWLLAICHNLAVKLLLGERRRAARERTVAQPEALPPTEEILAREAVRRSVIEAVVALGEPYRTTMLWRYLENLPPREIAHRQGVPVETVRTRIKRALDMLRARLDSERGDARRGWALLLTPLAARPSLVVASAGALLNSVFPGALIMAAKAKAAIVVAAIVLASAATVWQVRTETDQTSVASEISQAPGEPVAADRGSLVAEPTPSPPVRESVSAPARSRAPTAALGSLDVQVLWQRDRAPVAAALALVYAVGSSTREAATDREGRFTLDELPPGPYVVRIERGASANTSVVAGERAAVTLELSDGITVRGRVVDDRDDPVAGASITWSDGPFAGRRIAESARDGTFELRGCTAPGYNSLGAFSPRYAPSKLHAVQGPEGSILPITFRLEGLGGELIGVVCDASGNPVGEASVQVVQSAPRGSKHRGGTTPQHVVTDAAGRFLVRGLASGENDVMVRKSRLAPTVIQTAISPQSTAQVHIDLVPPVTVQGSIVDHAGHGVASVSLDMESQVHAFLSAYGRTNAEGRFTIVDIAPGEIHVEADGRENGKASETVFGKPGEVVEWRGVLDKGLRILGRLVDERDAPIPGFRVRAIPEDRSEKLSFSDGITHADGSFTLEQCRDVTHRIEVTAPETVLPAAKRNGVRPGDDVLIRIADRDLPSVRIMGRVIRADGKLGGGAQVVTWNSRSSLGPIHHTDPHTGSFDIKSLIPGTYRLHIQVPGQPGLTLPPHELNAGDTLDLGDIEIEEPGLVVVHLQRPAGLGTRPELFLSVAGDAFAGAKLELEKDIARSQPVAPGRYRLNVLGSDGIAASSRVIEVESGGVTEIDVALAAGATRVVNFRCARQVDRLHVVVTDQALEVAVERVVYPDREGSAQTNLCLAPGTYHVEATSPDGLRGTAALEIDALGNAQVPLDVAVR